jgi:hypothetical protein
MLPNVYGFPAPNRRLALAALAGLNLAVAGEAAGLVLMRLDSPAWAGLWYGSVLLLAGCVATLVRDWGVLGRGAKRCRTLKFVQAAYAWLFASLLMLVALPAYQFAVLPAVAPDAVAVRTGFSHAYYGATRHAITVGFVSQMIVGVAARVVPTLRGADPRLLPRLWAPFVLINLGCGLRVLGQTVTDWDDRVFPLIGASGVLEVAGLAVWGAHLAGLMLRRPEWAEDPDVRGLRPVEASDSVAAVLDRHPGLLPVFLEFGFKPLANPALRRTAARGVSIELACRITGADAGALLAALNARLPLPGSTVSLPVLRPTGPGA